MLRVKPQHNGVLNWAPPLVINTEGITIELRVINIETGEDKSLDYSLRHRNQDQAFQDVQEKERYKEATIGKRWVAGYHDPISNVLNVLTLIESGAIVKLLPYLRFKADGKLIKDGKPLMQKDIQRIFKRGKKATRDILHRLEELGIITVIKEGRSNVYYISANFHTIGNVREGEKFTKLYQVKTQEIVEDLDLSEVGLLYKILPFFHYEEYYLCANPNEKDPDIIQHLNREQLAEAISHDIDTVTDSVRKLQNKGALLSTKSGRTVRYLVHPDLMFRQSKETDWTHSVRKLFSQHRKK